MLILLDSFKRMISRKNIVASNRNQLVRIFRHVWFAWHLCHVRFDLYDVSI
jgi:hypothetical protein